MPGYVPLRCPRCRFDLSRLQSRVAEAQKDYPNAFTPWNKEDDTKLKELYEAGVSFFDIAEELGRQDTAIIKRVEKRQLTRVEAATTTGKSVKVASGPCPGPADESWLTINLEEGGLEDNPELFEPHEFQGQIGNKDACAVCTYSTAKVEQYKKTAALLAEPVVTHKGKSVRFP